MRRRTLAIVGIVLLALLLIGAVATVRFSDIVRLAVIWSVGSMTGREVTVDDARFDPLSGKFSLVGFMLRDRDGSPFATLERLEGRLHRRSLLRGHVWIHELALQNSAVRVVRYESGEFNLADLTKGKGGGGRPLDVTVDHFSLTGGTVTMEDRMLEPDRTWRSDAITLEARNVSTLKGGGTANGSTILNGAPVSVNVDDLGLLPARLRAVIDMRGGDLALARVYLPPNTPVTIDRGQLETRITVTYDARRGLHIDGDGRIADAVVLRRHQKDPVATAPEIRFTFKDLSIGHDGTFALARFEASGGASGQATAAAGSRFEISRLRAVVESVTWPVRGPARIDVASTVPGGGEVSVRGTARANPERADVDVRAKGVDLAPWARFIPTSARITGVGDAQFKVVAQLGAKLSATAHGAAGVNGLAVADGDRRLVAADRAEVSGLDVGWPLRVRVGTVRLVRPSAIVERDAEGQLALTRLFATPADTASKPPPANGQPAPSPTDPIAIDQVVIEDGRVRWRDATVKPEARIDADAIRVTVRDGTWPVTGPLRVALQARVGGGRVDTNGTVTVEPLAAELHTVANAIDLGTAAPYLGLPVRIVGRSDADLRVTVARGDPTWRATARGRAALSALTVTDANTRVASVDRIELTGLDVDWPTRAVAQRVAIQRPWLLVERTDRGDFPLRAIAGGTGRRSNGAATADAGSTVAASPDTGAAPAPKLAVSIRQAVIEDGTIRFVDRTTQPAFTEELRRLTVRAAGVATAPANPAKYEMSGTLDGVSRLQVRGRVGAFDGPLFVDGEAELRDFLIPRVNPYMRQYVAWEARDGRFSSTVKYRVEGDALDARSDIRIGRLDVIKVNQDDAAQRRIGLPLGMVAGLMKDSRGEIKLAIPVGGRLSDPQFELNEAIWGAIRAIAIKTIAAPVSWIGRLRVGRDSKIEDIEIDPVTFEAGTPKLTPQGADQIERLSGYLRNSAGARMVLTPVVTIGDLDQLRAEALEAIIKERSRERGVSDVVAAQQLYAERLGDREPPKTSAEIVAALRDTQPPPAEEAQRLATKRADLVRDTLKKAGIDEKRLEASRDTEGLEAPDGGRVEIALTDRVRPKKNLLAQLIQKLIDAVQRPAERAGGPRAAGAPSTLVADQPPATVLPPRDVPGVAPGEQGDRRAEKPDAARDVPGR